MTAFHAFTNTFGLPSLHTATKRLLVVGLCCFGSIGSAASVAASVAASGAESTEFARQTVGHDSGAQQQAGLLKATYNNRRHHRYNRYHRSDRRNYSRPLYRSNGYRSNGYRARDFRSNRNFRSSRNFRNGGNYGYSQRGCQRVSTRGYWHGRRALVGGRECVNARGYSYIVPNSRYLIRYR